MSLVGVFGVVFGPVFGGGTHKTCLFIPFYSSSWLSQSRKMYSGAGHKSEFDFNELIKEGVESIQPTVSHHKIEVTGKVDALVTADRNRLEQVFTNLLTNAIKYSPEANRVEVVVQQNGDSVQVSVRDFGIGIDREKQDKIFERFYRVESSAKRFSGLGIGLYISDEIIKRHNGTLKVESEEGRGATFTFTLPLTQIQPQKG